MNRILSRLSLLILSTLILAPNSYSQGITTEDIFLAYLRTGQSEDALEAFSGLAEENPRDYLAHAFRGFLLQSHGSPQDAMNAFLDAVERGGDQPEATLFVYEALSEVRSREDTEILLNRFQSILQQDRASAHLKTLLRFYCGKLKERLGQWDEAQTDFDQLNFITKYWTCGPFDNAEKGGHDKVFGPEENVSLDASYPGRHREVSWRQLPDVNFHEGYINLHDVVAPSQESSTYLLAQVNSTANQRCRISFGHAGALKVWLNGKLITDVNRYHTPQLDQINIDERLSQGSNTLLIKLSSGETGKYGLYARLEPDSPGSVSYSLSKDDASDLRTPNAGQSSPPTMNQEPIALQQLKAMAESPRAGLYHHMFYALMIQRLDVTDENDQSANSMLSQINQLFSDNPLLIRLLGDSEKQANRARMAYERIVELSPNDRAAYTKLFEYYRDSEYATKAYDLYRAWDQSLPGSEEIQLAYAQLLQKNGLQESAVNQLKSLLDTNVSLQVRWQLFRLNGNRMTESDQAEVLNGLLAENAERMDAIAWLQKYALRHNDLDQFFSWIEAEQRIVPLSTNGLLDLVRYYQAAGEYEKSLHDPKGSLASVFALSPDNFAAHRLAAVAYHAMHQDEKALEHIARALEVQPSDRWCMDYQKLLQASDENYATPYLKEWQDVEVPDSLDLSKANYVVLRHQEITKVHPNGNSSETVREAIKILTDTGVRMQQVRGVYYESGLEEVRVTRARVWKPDGSYIDAPRARHQSTSSAADARNMLYQDIMVAVVQFPALEKGSVIEFEYEKNHTTENIFADYFGDIFYMGDPSLEPSVEREYVLITPTSRDFYWNVIDPNYPESVNADIAVISKQPEIDANENERVYRWTGVQLPTIPREPMMPAVTEIIPYIKISTFKTWDDMTTWWWNLSKDQLVPGTVVKQKLEQILAEYRVKNGFNSEEQLTDWDYVNAVNDYVNTDIRYLGLEFGIDGFKPHKVDEICNARYGDCKDKAALAVAMLTELGVEANMIIVRTTDRGEIDYELPSLGIFNHAIYYVPNADGRERWIDGTATFFGANELPSGDAGANSLIVKPGGGHEFKRIPHSTADENGGVYTTVLEVDADGNATGYRAASFRGLYNPIVRRSYENQSKAKEMVDRTLVSRYPGASSSNIQLSDLEDYSTDESVSYEMNIPNIGTKQNNRMQLPVTMFPEAMSQRFAQLSKREYDLVLNYPWTRTNKQTYTLPDEAGDVAVPQDRTITTKYGEYKRTSEINGKEVNVSETLVFDLIRLPKDEYQDFRDFCRLVDEAQEEKVQYSISQ